MKLIVGLGNPGDRYTHTWHNAGFWLVERLVEDVAGHWQDGGDRFLGETASGVLEGHKCLFLKPSTFMNLSGRSVQKTSQFFKIASHDWLILHDDIDLTMKRIRARVGGGHGGHNGVRSIIDVTGRSDFHRIKLGVGRPAKNEDSENESMSVSDFVLKKLSTNDARDYTSSVIEDVRLRLKDFLKS